MRTFVCALVACAVGAPAFAEPPKVRALTDIYAAGFHDCAETMAELVTFVHEDDDAYAYLGVWSEAKPNDETATVITAQSFTDGEGVSTISATKTAAGGCNGTVTQVLTTPKETCKHLRDNAFKDWKSASELNRSMLLDDPTTPNARVVLTPVGKSACVIVKQVIRFGEETP